MVHVRKMSSASWWLFLAGLGSETQIHFFGSIAITELFFYALAPILFFMDYRRLKHDGFLPWIWLTILTCFGCLISSKVNETYWLLMLKGVAVPAVYFAAAIVFHRLLHDDLSAMKWFLIGNFLSSIVCVFIFQPETFTRSANGELASGEAAVEAVVGYALFWSSRITAVLTMPVKCCYLQTPVVYSSIIPIVCAAILMFFSGNSGRSAAAVAIASMAMLVIGGKSRKQIARLGKHFWLFLIVGCIFAVIVKNTYSFCAQNGVLGDVARTKYEKQTATGTGILNILMAGRMELFCGLHACWDYPIIGLGPRPEDRNGYTENYLRKYASQEDFDNYIRSVEFMKRRGEFYRGVPDHSHIVYFWLRYGFFGLLLWLYVFWLMFKYVKKYSSSIPQWYGYMCLATPAMIWNILFSPPGGRLTTTFFIVCMLFCQAIANGKVRLPVEMELEVMKHDAR